MAVATVSPVHCKLRLVVCCLLQPVTDMEDPYVDSPPKCILCKHNVELDYKVCCSISANVLSWLDSWHFIFSCL